MTNNNDKMGAKRPSQSTRPWDGLRHPRNVGRAAGAILTVGAALSGSSCADDREVDDFASLGGFGGEDVTGGDGATGGGGGEARGSCEFPEDGLYARFTVNGEWFGAHLTDEDAMYDAIALWLGESDASIPHGRLICEHAESNCDYSWHMEPGSISFAEITVEVCDGAPSYIGSNCDSFVDSYCPWGAELEALFDCRLSGCPLFER